MAGYNTSRAVDELLQANEQSPPSFTVHLHPDHWTLNGGSKFLYNNQIASLLDDIRAQRIPTDFLELFEAAKLPFYDGRMIVELLDYRPLKGKDPELTTPKRTRVVLSPTSETLWADICLLNHRAGNVWTDEEAFDVEAKILLATSPPLCLDPDPHLTRIANNILRVSAPATPASLKRKAVAMEPEEDESEKARRAKIMQYMNPRINRSTIPSYRILDVIERMKQQRPPPAPTPTHIPPAIPPPQPPTSYPLNARPTPAPPNPTPGPTPIPHAASAASATGPVILPIRKSATPAPPVASSPSLKSAKSPEIKKLSQSPVISARPPSTVSLTGPAALPPHMQQYQAGSNMPSPPAHAPRPPSTAVPTHSPMPAERPLSTAPPVQASPNPAHLQAHLQAPVQARGKTPMPQLGPSPRAQSVQPALQVQQAQQQLPPPQMALQVQQATKAPPQAQPSAQQLQAAAQAQLQQQIRMQQHQQQQQQQQPSQGQQTPQQPQQQATQQPAANLQGVNVTANLVPRIASRGKTPQQAAAGGQTLPQLGQANNAAYYQYAAHQQHAARMNQGTSGQTGAVAAQAALMAQRNNAATRAQQATPRPAGNVPQTPQMGHAQAQNYNYAALMQNHLQNAGVRPATHAQLMQHQQHQFPGGAQAAAAAAAQQGAQVSQDQSQMQQNAAQAVAQYQQLYGINYTQMMNAQMQQGRVPQGYPWPMGAGRGMVPNISGHPQQMQLGAGKAGMQGSS